MIVKIVCAYDTLTALEQHLFICINILNISDLQVQLKNAIYKELIQLQNKGGVPGPLEVPLPHLKEPLDFLREAQEDWESKLRRGINALCTEKGVPLSKEVPCSKGVPLSKEVPWSKFFLHVTTITTSQENL